MNNPTADLQHANPLGQHPANLPYLPIRRSSLFFSVQIADHVNHPNAPTSSSPASATAAAAAEESVVQSVRAIQIEDRTETEMDCREDQVELLFGPDTGKPRQDKKRARSMVSFAIPPKSVLRK